MTPGQNAAALNDAFNAGVHALQAKQYDEAVTRLGEAAEIDPTQPAVWANLGDAYIGQAGTRTGADFDPLVQKGIAAYEKSIALKPNDAGAHNNYALTLARAKKFPEAQAELKTAAELDPTTAFVRYYNLGALMSNTGQAKAATAVFKMAIDSAPNNPTAPNLIFNTVDRWRSNAGFPPMANPPCHPAPSRPSRNTSA
jgi:tetratricopeptide (TPR) repeat protein